MRLIPREDDRGETPTWLGEGLRRSLLNYLERRGLDLDVRQWLDDEVPSPHVPSAWLVRLLKKWTIDDHADLGAAFGLAGLSSGLRAERKEIHLTLTGFRQDHVISLPEPEARWLEQLIREATPRLNSQTYPHMRDACRQFPGRESAFNVFLATSSWKKTREAGLAFV